MAYFIKKPDWQISESQATPHSVYVNRRKFIKQLGLGSLAIPAIVANCRPAEHSVQEKQASKASMQVAIRDLFPARRNDKYTLDRPLTDELVAGLYNNYYEFTTDKDRVAELARDFIIDPWRIEISGLVNKPITIEYSELIRKFDMQERLYRFRCVERWAMAVPWTGIPLREIVRWADPLSSARYVRFVSFLDSDQAPGQKQAWYPWPYFEGLSMEEATNELTLLVTGIYGHELPNQHGSPMRLIVPWKYGYKSAKGIQKIEFLDHQPETFWHQLAASEYGFVSNVDPEKPHPRWSQRIEWLIDTRQQLLTQKYNGYGEYVADLYE